MKQRLLLLILLCSLPTSAQVQDFTYTNNGGITITRYTGTNTAVKIPSSITGLPVTSIGDRAFYGCTSLTSVMIPDSLTSIGTMAFYCCTSLTSVIIPDNVTSISRVPFAACNSLLAISVAPSNACYTAVDGVLFNKAQTVLIQYPGGRGGNYTIPNSATNIAYGAFAGCYNLTNITFGDKVTIVEDYSFTGCLTLSHVIVNDNVTIIGDSAFKSCPSLVAVCFKGNAPNIGIGVFPNNYHNITVYYLPGTKGWGPTFGGRPTAVWKP